MADYTAGIDSFCRYVMRVRYPTEEYLDSIYKFIFQFHPERAESFRNYTDWLRDNPKEYPYLCSLNSLSTQVDTTSRFKIRKIEVDDTGKQPIPAFLARIQAARSHMDAPAVVSMRRHGYITPADLDWFFQRVDKTSPFWHTEQWTAWKLYGMDWLIEQVKILARQGQLAQYDNWFRDDRLYLTYSGNSRVMRDARGKTSNLAQALLSRHLSRSSVLPQDRRLVSIDRIQRILTNYISTNTKDERNITGCATEWMLPGIHPRAICDLAIWRKGDKIACPSTIIEMETYPVSKNTQLRQHPYAVYELSVAHRKKIVMIIVCAGHVREDAEIAIHQMSHLVKKGGCVEVRIYDLSDVLSMQLDMCKCTSIVLGSKS